MINKYKQKYFLLLLIAVAVFFTGCGKDTTTGKLDQIKERGVLLVGTTGDYQPMSYLNPQTGQYEGFDARLAQELADNLGVELKYVPTSWPTLMEDTQKGKFDLAICGITITDARKEQALMSVGYFGNGKTILVRAEDADKYQTLEDINRPEVRVMENPGGLNEKFVRENLPDATLIIHDKNEEIPGLIAAGEADVMVTEIMEAGFYVGQDDRLAAPLIDEPFTHGELGALMPKGSEDLLSYVNAFLDEKMKSGWMDELAEEYIYQYVDKDSDDWYELDENAGILTVRLPIVEGSNYNWGIRFSDEEVAELITCTDMEGGFVASFRGLKDGRCTITFSYYYLDAVAEAHIVEVEVKESRIVKILSYENIDLGGV